jgi:hypothetical protein
MRMQLKDSAVLSGEEPFLQLRILELRLCRCDRRHSRRCAHGVRQYPTFLALRCEGNLSVGAALA